MARVLGEGRAGIAASSAPTGRVLEGSGFCGAGWWG